MWKLGLWPSNSFSGNISFEYFGIVSLQCMLRKGREGDAQYVGVHVQVFRYWLQYLWRSLLGDKVNSGIGLSYRPQAHVAWLADNAMPELTLSPQSGSMNSATGAEYLWSGGSPLCLHVSYLWISWDYLFLILALFSPFLFWFCWKCSAERSLYRGDQSESGKLILR